VISGRRRRFAPHQPRHAHAVEIARECPARRHPTTARAQQSGYHVRLSPRHRQRGDHRDRARSPRAGDPLSACRCDSDSGRAHRAKATAPTLRAMASWAERHLVNFAVRVGVRLGREIDGVQELEVRGRRTGKPRRTPVKVLEVDGERYLVSLNGSSGWVCNLRARSAARLRFGRRVEEVVATEVADPEKPPVVRAYRRLRGARRRAAASSGPSKTCPKPKRGGARPRCPSSA
jgi:deazaflavin-dependent oxidoreductase (nitroreductase family)